MSRVWGSFERICTRVGNAWGKEHHFTTVAIFGAGVGVVGGSVMGAKEEYCKKSDFASVWAEGIRGGFVGGIAGAVCGLAYPVTVGLGGLAALSAGSFIQGGKVKKQANKWKQKWANSRLTTCPVCGDVHDRE